MTSNPSAAARVPRRNSRRLAPRRAQAGVGLLEVMISVLILGIGLLGIAAMQATALRNGQSSLERTQAVIQTYAALDLLRANRTDAIAGYYNTGGMKCDASQVDGSLPTGQQAAQAQVNVWLLSLKHSMGMPDDDLSTCAAITCAANAMGGGTCTATISWDDSRGSRGPSGEVVGDSDTGEGSATRQVVTVAAL